MEKKSKKNKYMILELTTQNSSVFRDASSKFKKVFNPLKHAQ